MYSLCILLFFICLLHIFLSYKQCSYCDLIVLVTTAIKRRMCETSGNPVYFFFNQESSIQEPGSDRTLGVVEVVCDKSGALDGWEQHTCLTSLLGSLEAITELFFVVVVAHQGYICFYSPFHYENLQTCKRTERTMH